MQLVDFESEAETDLFVNYTAILRDDGESASGAIAIYRNWAIVTDDKAAINLLFKENPNLELFSTPDMIKYWSDKDNLTHQTLKDVLLSIQTKGRYFPPKTHPLKSWWSNNII